MQEKGKQCPTVIGTLIHWASILWHPTSMKKGKANIWGEEVDIDVPDWIIAPGPSSHLDELIVVLGLRGGSPVMGGLSARGWRMLRFEIRLMISRSSLAIIAIGASDLLRSSCHLTLANCIGLMRRFRS
jgi:hypothetical protein